MKALKVRMATAADVDALVHQRHMMFEDMRHPTPEDQKIGDDAYRRWAPAMIRRGLLRCYLVTGPNGEIAAGGCVWMREAQPGPGHGARRVPYLLSMYTEPKFRRQGCATMIVREAMRWAAREGCSRMTLHASKDGRKVYQKLGWRRTWEMETDL